MHSPPHDIKAATEWLIRDIASHQDWHEEVNRGKMFGIMIVDKSSMSQPHHTSGCNEESAEKFIHYVEGVDGGVVVAYSGQILGRSDWEGYVPAIYDYLQPDGYFKTHEAVISSLNQRIQSAQALVPKGKRTREIEEMKAERKERSQALQRWLFTQFMIANPQGEKHSVLEVFQNYALHNNSKQTVPPGGTGECCAPKLLHFANSHGIKVKTIAEFWYGESPKGEIRHHGQFYEPCQAKCMPLMDFLAPSGILFYPFKRDAAAPHISIIYEDEWFIAICKSAGLLSVPGKRQLPNAQDMLKEAIGTVGTEYPKMTHRLDMDTSGILLAAKTEEAFVAMQRLFATHNDVRKEYIAILSEKETERDIATTKNKRSTTPDKGTVSLPLAPDFINRPMQCVDFDSGKESITEYTFIDHQRVLLYPLTGRTHQLRIHCAHAMGLNRPILGDTLYGNTPAQRMFLHAQRLSFRHPFTGNDITIENLPDF